MLALFCNSVLVAVLCCIAIQDWKYRSIHWWCLPVLAVAITGRVLLTYNWESVALFGGYNVAFLVLQFVVLTLWFSLRNGHWILLTRQHLGWGDVLFFLAIAFAFAPHHFLLFCIAGSLFALLLHLAVRQWFSKQSKLIPLAGYLSVVVLLWLGLEWVFDVPAMHYNQQIF